MSIDLNEVLKNPAILSVLATIGAFVLSTFLAPRLGEIIKSLAAFIFFNIKHWIYFILLAVVFHFTLDIPVFINISLTITGVTIISVFINFHIFSKKPTLLYLGSYYNNDNTYLDKNLKTEKIDSIVDQEIDNFKKHSYLVKMGIIKIKSMDIPRFYTLMKSYKSLNLLFKKLVGKNVIFGFSFFSDSESDSIHYDSYLNANKHKTSIIFQENLEAIQDILESENINQRVKISLSIKVNFLFISQSFNDMFIAYNDSKSLKYSLDDNWKILNNVKEDMRTHEVTSVKTTSFVNTFEVSYHRYYAMLMFMQKNIEEGIKKIFYCIKLNTYFPYDNYNDFKRQFATRYYTEMLPLLLNEENKESNLYAEVMSTYDILLSRIEDNVVLFNIDIFKEFLDIKDLNEVHIKLIETELGALEDNIPNLLFKSEVLKFLPRGTEQIMNIYIDRIKECITALQRIIEIDPSFPLIHQKIGFLKFLYSISKDDETLVEEAKDSLRIGFDEITNLGVSLVNDSNDIDEVSVSSFQNSTSHN